MISSRVDPFDAVIVVGAVIMVVGLGLVNIPAAVIVAGLLLVLFGIASGRRSDGTSR